MNNLPTEYRTGNKKMDEKIAAAFEKQPQISHNQLLVATQAVAKPHKYHIAEKEDRTYKDGVLFASKKEMQRWDFLLTLQRGGQIKDLDRQIPFVLQEEFTHTQHGDYKPILYVADFMYTDISYRKGCEGRIIVEDSKGGVLTQAYKIKKKLFLYKYGDYLFFEV